MIRVEHLKNIYNVQNRQRRDEGRTGYIVETQQRSDKRQRTLKSVKGAWAKMGTAVPPPPSQIRADGGGPVLWDEPERAMTKRKLFKTQSLINVSAIQKPMQPKTHKTGLGDQQWRRQKSLRRRHLEALMKKLGRLEVRRLRTRKAKTLIHGLGGRLELNDDHPTGDRTQRDLNTQGKESGRQSRKLRKAGDN